jgi:DNA-binding beta-propeller fold protein YncE
VLWVSGNSQEKPADPSAALSLSVSSGSAFSINRLPSKTSHYVYVGSFTKRGKFRDASLMGCMKEAFDDDPNSRSPEAMGAPPCILHSNERAIYDADTPIYRKQAARQRSRFSGLLDTVVEASYGGPFVLGVPKYITVDSQNRAIISDPAEIAVHVLDPKERNSFRIVAGRQYRLKLPGGVATDRADNIYIADSAAGVVLVYDRSGSFVRRIGLIGNEPLLARPTAIAVDPQRGRVYIADTPRNVIVVLDLQGKYIREFGKLRSGQGEPDFHEPTAVAVDQRGIAVLDSKGARLWLLSRAGHPVGNFLLGSYLQGSDESEGLALDHEGHVLVSSVRAGTLLELSRDGELLTSFGQTGSGRGEFRQPMGLYLGPSDKMYVADSQNGRVQVFQMSHHAEMGEEASTPRSTP